MEHPIRQIRQEKDMVRTPFAELLGITRKRLEVLEAGKEPINTAEKQAFVAKMGPVYDAAPAILKLDGDGQKLMAKFIEEGAKPAGK